MITRNMSIAEIVDAHPETAGVFIAYNLHCVGCGASGFETIEEGTLGHGWSEEELELLLKDLNEEIVLKEGKGKRGEKNNNSTSRV